MSANSALAPAAAAGPPQKSMTSLVFDLKKRKGLDSDKLVLYEDSEHRGDHHNGQQDDIHGKKHHGKYHADKE